MSAPGIRRVLIAYAALSDELMTRVRIAASALPAYRIEAKLQAWDGTRCDLAVVDFTDAYGRQAYGLAQRRGTPSLLFGADDEHGTGHVIVVGKEIPAVMLTQAIVKLIASAPERDAPAQSPGGALPPLCRLCAPELIGRCVTVSDSQGRTVRLRPDIGRVFADHINDLAVAQSGMTTPDWQIFTQGGEPATERPGTASASLEAFLLNAAFDGRDRLPPFAKEHYRLKDWPDVGKAATILAGLKVAKILLSAPSSVEEICNEYEFSKQDVNASFWAYRAANLLDEADTPQQQPRHRLGAFTGVLRRIADHFGLGAK